MTFTYNKIKGNTDLLVNHNKYNNDAYCNDNNDVNSNEYLSPLKIFINHH